MSGTLSLPVVDAPGQAPPRSGVRHVALVGNPNAGKTTLFNALTGLRAKTSNFPGTTVERRLGSVELDAGRVTLIDLPGMYALDAVTPEEKVAREVLLGERDPDRRPQAVVLVLDATNLDRNLFLASQVLPLGLPTDRGAHAVRRGRAGRHRDRRGQALRRARLPGRAGQRPGHRPQAERRGPDLRARPPAGEPRGAEAFRCARRLRHLRRLPLLRPLRLGRGRGRHLRQPPARGPRQNDRADRRGADAARRRRRRLLRGDARGLLDDLLDRQLPDGRDRLGLRDRRRAGRVDPPRRRRVGRPPVADRRRRDRRRGRHAHLPAADLHPLLLPRAARRLRLHGPGRLRDGSADAARRPARPRLRAAALGPRLRHPRRDGGPRHPRPARPAGDDPDRPPDELLGPGAGVRPRRLAAFRRPAMARLAHLRRGVRARRCGGTRHGARLQADDPARRDAADRDRAAQLPVALAAERALQHLHPREDVRGEGRAP